MVPQVFEYGHVSSTLPNPPITVTTVRMPTVSRRTSVHGPLWYPNVEMQHPPNVWRLSQSYAQSHRQRRPIKIEKPPDLQSFSNSHESQDHFVQQTELTESFTNKNILYEYKVVTKHTQQLNPSAQHLNKMEEIHNYKRKQNKREPSKPNDLKAQPNPRQENIKDHCTNNTATNRLRDTKVCGADKYEDSNKHSGKTREKTTETVKSAIEAKDSYEYKTVRKERTKTHKRQHIQINEREFDKKTSFKTYIKNESKDYYKTTKKESTSHYRKHNTCTVTTEVSHIDEVLKNNEQNHKDKGNVESVPLTVEHYTLSSYTKEPFIKYHKQERTKRHTTGQRRNSQEVSKGAHNFSKVSV